MKAGTMLLLILTVSRGPFTVPKETKEIGKGSEEPWMPGQGIFLELAGKGEPREDSKQGNGKIGLCFLEKNPRIAMKIDWGRKVDINNETTATVQAKEEEKKKTGKQ